MLSSVGLDIFLVSNLALFFDEVRAGVTYGELV